MNQAITPAIDRTALVASMFDIAKRPFYAANGWKVLDDVSADELDTVIGKRVRTVRGAARQVLNRLVKPAKANTTQTDDAGQDPTGQAGDKDGQPELQQADDQQLAGTVNGVLGVLNADAPASDETVQ